MLSQAQGQPNLFFGPYSSDFISSESSSVSDTDESPSGPLVLEQPLISKEAQTNHTSPNSGSIQIAELRFDSSQVSQDYDNGDQALEPRLYALDLPCQSILGDSNTDSMINESPIESSGLFAAGIPCLVMSQRRSDISQIHANLSPRQGSNEVPNGEPSEAEQLHSTGIEDVHVQPLEDNHLRTSGSLDPSSMQTSHPDTLCVPPSKVWQDNSALRLSPSPNHQHSLGYSHRVDAGCCEQIDSPSTETFKSPGGCSDDILSRSTFAQHERALDTEPDFKGRAPFESPSDISTTSLIDFCAASKLSEEKALNNILHSSEHILMDASSPTAVGEPLVESHEKMGMTSVSDHFNIPSSSPTAQTEYSQSNPYFEPATITRAHNPSFRTEVVGTRNLPSSSPPSSPSMSSNYVPSSSPISISSPVEESSQTPSSSPVNSDAYGQPVMLRGANQESIYTGENYAGFPHYAMDRMYYKPPEQSGIHDTFLPSSLHHLTSPPGSLLSSYTLDYFDQLSSPSATIPDPDQFSQNNTGQISPSIQSTSRTNQYSVEAVSNPSIDTTTYSTTPIDINHYDATTYGTNQHSNNQYEPLRYDSTQHESTLTQHEINSTVDIPQAPESNQANVIPRPKRSTLAGQRLQQKKLSKPFRSPVIHAPVRLAPKPASIQPTISIVTSSNVASSKDTRPTTSPSSVEQPVNAVASSSTQTLDTKVKHRTTRASSQFKSPLSQTSGPLDQATLVRLTPTIQSLERKLQLLRRALKVREDVQEEVLEGLVKKWSEAGREAAWEVWDVVKDNANSDEGRVESQGKGKKRAIEDSWGWDESGDPKKPKVEESSRNWGWDVVPVSDRAEEDANPEDEREPTEAGNQEEEGVEEDAPQPSLGTMLIQLGIAPDTLGWDEDEGTFVER